MEARSFAALLESLEADARRRGRQFEAICRWFLLNDPVYRAQLQDVWLWKEWPGRWGDESGVDLVAQTHDGLLWAIQAVQRK